MPKLVAMNIEETSGVDHPAHLREGWLVMKATDATEASELFDAIRAAAGRTVNPEDTMPEETPEVETASVDELAKANERIAELEAALAATTTAEETAAVVDEDLLKSVPEAVRKMLDEQSAQVADALAKAAATEDELRKERAARADEAAIAKAAGWTSLSLDAAAIGPMLRRLSEVDADLAKSVEGVLEAANAQAETAGIFAEIGKAGRPDSGDAYATLESLAKAAVEGGTYPTFEQAFVKVVEQNPDLYIRHLSEKGA